MSQASQEQLQGVSPEITGLRFSGEAWARTSEHVPTEMEFTVYVNERQLVTMLCTPTKLNCLVLGFLYAEEIISTTRDISAMRVCLEDALADVRLVNADFKMPEVRTLTSGCGQGMTSGKAGKPVDSDLVVEPQQIIAAMKQLEARMELYRVTGGVHASALADGEKLLVVAEDIGRHNTLDKIQGECMLRDISTRDKLLLSTGRISSEMVLKAARMQSPLVASRTSPTSRAVALGNDLGIAVVGYARAGRLTVYSHPERLGAPAV
jgi:FdhD protein